MALTKQQAINFLQNKKQLTAKASIKYYTIGVLSILVQKNVITVADIIAEFPELNT
jgi:hypothetical protein